MSRARVEEIPRDPAAARALIEKARRHARDARSGVGEASQYVLGYQSCLDSMTGILIAQGKRAGSGLGGHIELMRAAREALPSHDELFDRIDAFRRLRHQVAYDGEEPPTEACEELVEAAVELAELAWQRIGD